MDDPILSAFLQSWGWRIDVMIVLVLAGTIYTLGWYRLRRIQQKLLTNKASVSTPWQLASYGGGLFVVSMALMSPIDTLGSVLFTFHMIQHLLLMMIAPPLLLLANPFPCFVWGLPPQTRRPLMTTLLNKKSSFRQALHLISQPGIVWAFFVITFVGWHDPNAYNAALQYEWVHDIEHLNFFGAAMLFWWHVIGAGPHIHKRLSAGKRIGYLLVTIPPNMLTGIAIAFSTLPVYSHYTTVPRLFGLSVIEDQRLGAVIMWVPGSMMYIIAVLVIVAGLLQIEENKPPLPHSEWATDEAMLAPGIDKK